MVSTDARSAMDESLSGVGQLMAKIAAGLNRYETMERPNWEHAGSMAHVENLLAEVSQFVNRTPDVS